MVGQVEPMDGPAFLLFYAAVAAVLLGLCRWRNRATPRRLTPLRELPAEPDPYEVAWLRGGGTEIVRLAVYDLLRCSYLAIESASAAIGGTRRVARIAEPSPEAAISPFARMTWAACAVPMPAWKLLQGTLPKRIDERCRALRTRFEEQGLVIRPAQRVQGILTTLAAVAMLLVLGIWRIQDSLAHGHHNVLFLVVLVVISVAVALLAAMPPARLTSHGRAYLAGLVAGRPDARATASARADAAAGEPVSAGMTVAPALLGVALLGFPALAGTDYAVMDQLFPRAKAPSDGSSCSTGSSCGTSSSCGSGSSGGSDGGGGGSDGGGGCGGGGCGGGGD
jgi:uncharacterized protein (TIGR04222 family)